MNNGVWLPSNGLTETLYPQRTGIGKEDLIEFESCAAPTALPGALASANPCRCSCFFAASLRSEAALLAVLLQPFSSPVEINELDVSVALRDEDREPR